MKGQDINETIDDLRITSRRSIRPKIDEIRIMGRKSIGHRSKSTSTQSPKAQLIQSMLLDRLLYISHPTISCVECSINLYKWPVTLLLAGQNDPRTIFYDISTEIIQMVGANPQQTEIKYQTCSILFKGVSAMRLLNMLFKGNEDHALYPIYVKWLEGSKWTQMDES